MKREITFDLYLPPDCLWPNGRPNRYQKAAAVRKYRTDCGLIAQAKALEINWGPPARVATLQATFYLTARQRDPDNAIASMKAAIDGLKDAGIIADDRHLKIQPPEIYSRTQWVALGETRPALILYLSAPQVFDSERQPTRPATVDAKARNPNY